MAETFYADDYDALVSTEAKLAVKTVPAANITTKVVSAPVETTEAAAVETEPEVK